MHEIWWSSAVWFLSYASWQTVRQTDKKLTYSSQYFAPLPLPSEHPNWRKVRVLPLLLCLLLKQSFLSRTQIHSWEIGKSEALCQQTYRAYDGWNCRKCRNLSPWFQVKDCWKSKDREFKVHIVSRSSWRPFNKFRVAEVKVLKEHSKYQVRLANRIKSISQCSMHHLYNWTGTYQWVYTLRSTHRNEKKWKKFQLTVEKNTSSSSE